jgi:hypothetical protein
MTAAKRRPKSRKRTRRTRPSTSLPDLRAILSAYGDARALVSVAHTAMLEGNYGPEEHVLRMGVAALKAVYDQLDKAEMQLARFCEGNARARRGES